LNGTKWTNSSVIALADGDDPIKKIVEKTKSLVLQAMDAGWQGPPFDPFWLAQYLGMSTIPRDDIFDSLVSAKHSGAIDIEYNPNQSHARMRFSIAHEIGHTLFPDYNAEVRHRSSHRTLGDEWQLELLCNISAAEILMPSGLPFDFESIPVTIDNALQLRRRFDVSYEALLLRMVKLTHQPVTIFAASREADERDALYRVDYSVNSSTSGIELESGLRLPGSTVLNEVTAVGYTAKKRENWSESLSELYVECVGIPPYPGLAYPRVIGILRNKEKAESRISLTYLIGDASQPRGDKRRIIGHIVNDKTPNWGKGFALALARKYPIAYKDFQSWVASDSSNLSLGRSHLSDASEEVSLFHMVAQHGYGPSPTPRIRYTALRNCLTDLAKAASELNASVHMPRIGTGYAQGNWSVIKELIDDILIPQRIEVTVYDLPGQEIRPKRGLADFLSPMTAS